MAIVTNTFTRYSAVGMREDLSNVIWNVSPQDTPFVSNIGKRKITNTTFSWQQDQLANAAANAQIDGDDVSSYTAVVATTLRTNFSQIMRKTFIIADNLEVINEAGTGTVELTQGATLPLNKILEGAGGVIVGSADTVLAGGGVGGGGGGGETS